MQNEPLDECCLPHDRNYVNLRRDTIRRFWAKVQKSDEGCWLWMASKDQKGYGVFWIGDRFLKAQRASFLINKGYVPPSNLFICHKCDNPGCVRPDHLFVGSNQDNMLDMTRKGRSRAGEKHPSKYKPESVPKGEQHYAAVLNEDIVREIRWFCKQGISHQNISELYGVCREAITRVANRKTWKHVP